MVGEIVIKKVTALFIPHQRQHRLLAGGGALSPEGRVAVILAEARQLAAEFVFQQFGKIHFVFVEQRVQIHGNEIRRAVVETVRRVVAGFAHGAVVFEKLVERQAVRFQIRIFAA